jgi:hypothetical protein
MNYFLLLSLIVFLFSCSSEIDVSEGEKVNVEDEIDTQNQNSLETEEIITLFDSDTFENPKKEELLKEIKVCSDENKGPEDYLNPSCSPRFFEIFDVSKNTPLNSAFILQMKAKTNGFPLRRLVVFVRERGELVKVNGFVANLIERRLNSSGFDDLVLRFKDKDQGYDIFYNCLFKWSGTNYIYHSVEVIEGIGWGGPVKKDLKDSISIEVFKDIQKNKMIF